MTKLTEEEKNIEDGFDDKTVGEHDDLWARDIWYALPFTKGFVERHCDSPENAETICRKIDEYHKKSIDQILERKDKELVEKIEKALNELDEAEKSYPMAIINWSVEDRNKFFTKLITQQGE